VGTYISSSGNRFYVGVEPAYGRVGAVTAANRFPGVKLAARQWFEQRERKDKSGSRTFSGLPGGLRRRAEYSVRTYMTSWASDGSEPGYGPFFRAGLGGAPMHWPGGVAANGTTNSRIVFNAPHGLSPGQAVTVNGEIRFVAGVVDAQTVQLSAPFTIAVEGAQLGATVTYPLARELPSVSIFDYWDPAEAIHRIVAGAAVDRLRIRVNGDFHEFEFSGPAADVIDSASFTSGEGDLTAFPGEPELAVGNFSVVPGNLGQIWLGPGSEPFFTVTEAEIEVDNDVELRDREFGAAVAKGINPGRRSVKASVSLYALTDEATQTLYQAARQRSPISATLQLGQQAGQLCGVYLKSLIPEPPEYDDGGRRLEWHFKNCRAQGVIDDEIFVAFG